MHISQSSAVELGNFITLLLYTEVTQDIFLKISIGKLFVIHYKHKFILPFILL